MLLRSLALPVALTGALLAPALPAAADDDDDRGHRGHRRGHRGHGHYDRHHGGGHHRHHHGCGHGHGWGRPRYVVKNYYHHGGYGYPVHHYGYGGPVPYFCDPCGHYFDSYDHLSHHVHHHHHVAAIQLPFVIFQASIGGGVGWVFGP
jgi:hypothetical protein